MAWCLIVYAQEQIYHLPLQKKKSSIEILILNVIV
jgi:hypothetical protein